MLGGQEPIRGLNPPPPTDGWSPDPVVSLLAFCGKIHLLNQGPFSEARRFEYIPNHILAKFYSLGYQGIFQASGTMDRKRLITTTGIDGPNSKHSFAWSSVRTGFDFCPCTLELTQHLPVSQVINRAHGIPMWMKLLFKWSWSCVCSHGN